MRATEVLQKCLSGALDPMHALRRRVLLHAVEAMLRGRRLTLIDLARAWPDAERIRAPLKALDRLLGNLHLQGERYVVYHVMTRWLVRNRQPVVVIDWSDLKQDGSWHLLRAAIPVGGRTLPILDMVFPRSQQGSRKAEGQFLQRLAQVLPSDAGFGPWKRWAGIGWVACVEPRTSSRWMCLTHPRSGSHVRRCMRWHDVRHAISVRWKLCATAP